MEGRGKRTEIFWGRTEGRKNQECDGQEAEEGVCRKEWSVGTGVLEKSGKGGYEKHPLVRHKVDIFKSLRSVWWRMGAARLQGVGM